MDTPQDNNDLTQGIATESESEIQYRFLFELSPFGVLLIDDHGHIVKFNKAAYSDLGYTREEFQKITLADIDPIESPEEIQKSIEKTIKDGKAEFYVKHKTKYGENRDVHVITQPTVISDRYYFHTIWIDVTEKMRLERLQRESEKKFRTLFESANDGIFILSLKGEIIDANTIFHERLGYTKEELIGLNIIDIDPPEYAKLAPERMQVIRSQGRGVFEVAHKRKDGTFMPVETNLSLTEIGGEQVMLGIVRDITERKRIEDKLRQNEADLAEAQRIAKIGSWKWYIDTNEAHWSDETYRLFGLTRSKLDRHRESFLHLILPEDRQRVDQALSDALNGTRKYDLDYRIKLTDGTEKDIHAQAEVIRNNMGQPLLMRGTVQDITERKQAEEALRESEERLQGILDHAGLVIFVKDLQGRYIIVNRRYEELFKVTLQAIIGKTDYDIFPAEHAAKFQQHDRQVLGKDGVFEVEETVPHEDGLHTYISVRFPLLGIDGQPYAVCGIATDITERKKMEAELFQAHKMEAIGTLAGGIAHDFNNILTALLGYAEIAELEIPAGNPLKNNIEQIIKAGKRAAELVRQILTFSRKGPETQKPLQPSIIIKEGLKLIRASLPTTIDIYEDIDPECGAIVANPTNIHQILVNLCTNALHAMAAEKGVLTVKLKRVTISEHEAVMHSGVSAGPFVELLVNDTGCGMDSGIMGRIFEPYFTTKEVGKGSGMGLAQVHGIVQGCGGFIKVESELGKGSTFRVYFPVVAEESTITKDDKKPKSLPKGDERILAVDDEQAIVGMYKASLEKQGYTVTAHYSSEKVLEDFRRSPNSFDLIITDQTMPHLPGSELAKQLLQIRPDIPIILCTGHSSTISEEKAKEIGIAKFLMKPVSRDDLAINVREVLDKHKTKNF